MVTDEESCREWNQIAGEKAARLSRTLRLWSICFAVSPEGRHAFENDTHPKEPGDGCRQVPLPTGYPGEITLHVSKQRSHA